MITMPTLELRWQGQPVEKLLVVAPEAYGDCFERARWLPELTKRHIDWRLVIRPELLSVFRTAFPDNQISAERLSDTGFWVDALDGLAAALRMPRPPAMQFRATPEKIEKYQGLPKPAVGICVQAAARQGDNWRSLKEHETRKVIQAVPQANWVSLQHPLYLKGYTNPLPCLRPEFESWDDTLGLIENLDAVVTVDSAIAHLAACMGKRTCILLGTAPTSITTYVDYKNMYPAAPLQIFTPIYGGSQAAHAYELFIRRTKNPDFLRVLTQGTLQ